MEKFTKILEKTTVTDKNISMIPDDFSNIIFYGSSCSKKYEHALNFIRKRSPSALTYEKKLTVAYNNDEYIYKISDVHIEINFEFLGCISKNLWAAIYEQINIFTRATFIVLCKNFSKISNELIDHFYTYMNERNKNIHYILLVDNISCIPKEIIDLSTVIPIKSTNKKNHAIIQTEYLSKLVTLIENNASANINDIRTLLYDLLIYQIDVYNFFYLLLEQINEIKKPSDDQFIRLLSNLNKVLKLFNNNYRSIYHLENYVVTIITELNS